MAEPSFGLRCEAGSSRLLGVDTTCSSDQIPFTYSSLTRPPSGNVISCICAIRERTLGCFLDKPLSSLLYIC